MGYYYTVASVARRWSKISRKGTSRGAMELKLYTEILTAIERNCENVVRFQQFGPKLRENVVFLLFFYVEAKNATFLLQKMSDKMLFFA